MDYLARGRDVCHVWKRAAGVKAMSDLILIHDTYMTWKVGHCRRPARDHQQYLIVKLARGNARVGQG